MTHNSAVCGDMTGTSGDDITGEMGRQLCVNKLFQDHVTVVDYKVLVEYLFKKVVILRVL